MLTSEYIDFCKRAIHNPSPAVIAYIKALEDANNLPSSTHTEVCERSKAFDNLADLWLSLLPDERRKLTPRGGD